MTLSLGVFIVVVLIFAIQGLRKGFFGALGGILSLYFYIPDCPLLFSISDKFAFLFICYCYIVFPYLLKLTII